MTPRPVAPTFTILSYEMAANAPHELTRAARFGRGADGRWFQVFFAADAVAVLAALNRGGWSLFPAAAERIGDFASEAEAVAYVTEIWQAGQVAR